jgi:hypothetical protein
MTGLCLASSLSDFQLLRKKPTEVIPMERLIDCFLLPTMFKNGRQEMLFGSS